MDGQAAAVVLSPVKDTSEILALSGSAGYRVVRTFVQAPGSPNPKYFLGEGKVHQIGRYIARCGGGKAPGAGTAGAEDDEDDDEGPDDGPCGDKPEVAIFNGNLKPTQVFHLEKALGIPVFDRIRLILEIFTRRANSPEARLQVELARLQYDVPLVREYIHRTRTGEHPGLFFAGGAYQVDDYYQMIKSRMAKIRSELERIGLERAQRRKTRRRGGQALVSLAGYTNAGKSALFRALCSEEAVVGDELFTTLSTTTRRLRFPVQGSKVLLTDTVGFIRNLPPWLIEAFMSTLEEVFLSDAIVLVVDLADGPGETASKLATTLGILQKGDRNIPVMLALNKTDLLDGAEALRRAEALLSVHNLPRNCMVSAVTGAGLDGLVRLTLGSLPDFFFGDISGPATELGALAAEGIRPDDAPAGGAPKASCVLLRNWQVQALAREHPALLFSSAKPPAPAMP